MLEIEMTMLVNAELSSQSHLYIWIYRQGIINKHQFQFGGFHL